MKKGILLIVVLLAILSSIVSAGLFSGVWQDYLTGRQIQQNTASGVGFIEYPAESCTDSDGGIRYSVKGTLRMVDSVGKELVVTDSCISDSQLKEYGCSKVDGGKWWYAESSPLCVEGTCKDGACTSKVFVGEKLLTPEEAQEELERLEKPPICGDDICENSEKQISCSKEYTFEDGLKHEMCWTNSQNCPVDCGRTIGDYDGEKLDAPICGDGKCEGVESKKICKITPGLKQEHCQSACLPDCGVIALNAPKDFSVPIEIPNKNKGPFGFGGSDAYIINGGTRVGEIFILIKEPIFRFHRFTSIGECHDYLCLEGVRSDAVDLKVRETSYIDRDLFNLYGIIPPKHKWIVFDNLPYYNHLRIKQSKDSVTYKQFTPIFDGIVEIEYYIDKPHISELSNKEMECINDVILRKNIDVPVPCKMSVLSVNPILSSYDYTQNELAYVKYYCLSTMRKDYTEEWNACLAIFKRVLSW